MSVLHSVWISWEELDHSRARSGLTVGSWNHLEVFLLTHLEAELAVSWDFSWGCGPDQVHMDLPCRLVVSAPTGWAQASWTF